MQEIRTNEDGLTWLAGLLKCAPSLAKLKLVPHDGGHGYIKVDGSDTELKVKVGRRSGAHYYERLGENIPPTQIVLTARNAERSSYGYWGDKARVFPIDSQTQTANGAGIIRALEQLCAEMRTATQARKEQDGYRRNARRRQEETMALLKARGLVDIRGTTKVFTGLHGLTATLSVLEGGSIELKFLPDDPHVVLALLNRLGVGS